MVDKRIKGLSIQLGLETTSLDAAMKNVEKASARIGSELRDVQRQLKFDPKNTELLSQKQKLLTDQISNTSKKLDGLKKAQEQVNEQFAKGEITAEQHRAFQREIAKTESQLKHYETQLKAVNKENDAFKIKLEENAKRLQAVGAKLESAGVAMTKGFTAPILGATAAITAMIVKTSDAGNRVDKLSQQIGLSRRAFQEWDYVLDQTGGNIDSLKTGMSTLAQAAESDKDTFKQLGVEIHETNGQLKSQEKLLYEVVSALQKEEDITRRNALAKQLLGRSATELSVLLNSEAGELEALTERAHELGLVLENDVIDKSVKTQDLITDLKRSFGAVTTELMSSLMPTFHSVSNLIIDRVVPALKSAGEKLDGLVKWFSDLDPKVQSFIGGLTLVGVAAGPVVTVIGKLAVGASGLASALVAVNAAMGPLGWAILGITAGVAGLGLAISATNRDLSKMYDRAIDGAKATKAQADELQNLIDEYKKLEGKPDKSEQEHKRLEEVMQAIIKIQPDIAAGYRDIGDAIKDNIDVLDDYVKALRAQGETQIIKAQIEFEIRRPELEAELEKLEAKAKELEIDVKPLQKDALGVAAQITEYKRLMVEFEKEYESGMYDAADAIGIQLRAIMEQVMPELDTGYDEFGRWQVGLDNYLKTLNKSAGGTADELKKVETQITALKNELAKGEALATALDDMGTVAMPKTSEVKQRAQEITEVIVKEDENLADKRAEFEADWQKRLFNLKAEELEKLDAYYETQYALAEELEADITDLKEAYGIEKAEIEKKYADERAAFERSINDQLFDLVADRVDQLQKERQIRVAEAELMGADVAAVHRLYDRLVTIEREKQADERAAIVKAETDWEIAEAERKKKAHEAFEGEWNKKLFELSADRIDILQREKQIEIQKAIEAGEDWWKVDRYYNLLIEQERQKLADDIAKIAQAEADEEIAQAERLMNERIAFNEEWNRKLFEQTLGRDGPELEDKELELRLQMQKRVDILQRQKQIEIQTAIETGQDWLLVDQYYNNLIQEERQNHYSEIEKMAQEQIEEEKRVQQAKENLAADWARRSLVQKMSRLEQLHLEYQEALKAVGDNAEAIASITSYYEREITEEKERQQAERDRLADEALEKEERRQQERLSFEKSWSDKLANLKASDNLEMQLELLAAEAKEMEYLAAEMEASAQAIENIQLYYAKKRGEIEEQIAEDNKSRWERIMDNLEAPMDKMANSVMQAAGPLADVAKAVATGNWADAFMTILMETEAFGKAMELLGKVLDPVIALFDSVLGPIINFLLDLWNGIITALSKISIFGWKPFGGLADKTIDKVGEGGDAGGGAKSGGTRVSEITGPTRDLLVDLMTPLAKLHEVVAPVRDIKDYVRDIRDYMSSGNLQTAGAGVGGVDIHIAPGAFVVQGGGSTTTDMDKLASRFARKVKDELRGVGRK